MGLNPQSSESGAKPSKLRKWAKKLLDPGVTQGNRALRNEKGGLCCLGVLIHGEKGVTWEGSTPFRGGHSLGGGILKEGVFKEFTGCSAKLDQAMFASANDGDKQTFPEISSFLREVARMAEQTSKTL